MAECFWTDLVGCEQELCGGGEPSAFFAVAEVHALSGDGRGEFPFGFLLAKKRAYECSEGLEGSSDHDFVTLAYAQITGVSAYTWSSLGSCTEEWRIKLACGVDVGHWDAYYMYAVGPGYSPYGVTYVGDLPNRPMLIPSHNSFPYGDFTIGGGDWELLWDAAHALDENAYPMSFKIEVTTDLGVFDWWYFASNCY